MVWAWLVARFVAGVGFELCNVAMCASIARKRVRERKSAKQKPKKREDREPGSDDSTSTTAVICADCV